MTLREVAIIALVVTLVLVMLANGINPQVGAERPRNCATAVASGLSAEEAARWEHLDRDGDGVACYGD